MRPTALLLATLLLGGCRFDMPDVTATPDTAALPDASPFCGNGVINPEFGEQCDDGNFVNGDGCDANCTKTACGNGVVTGSEECDDGNTNKNDECTVGCKNARCGDGFPRAGVEECDDGNTVTEQCTYGQSSCAVCDSTCQLEAGATSFCGDGLLQEAHEGCDDGNNSNCGTCDSNCGTLNIFGKCPAGIGCNSGAAYASNNCVNKLCQ